MSLGKNILPVLTILIVLCAACGQKKITKVVDTYDDGKPKQKQEYIVNEDGTETLYKETFYFEGEKKYIEGTYNPDGKRDSIWMSWHNNGNKNSQCGYVDGIENGDYYVWYPNGKMRYEGKYTMGKRVGTWIFYDSNGVKTKEEVF